jgi:hypothetical protein
MAGFPGGMSPDIMKMLQGLGGGGGAPGGAGSHVTPFMAGMGFDKFASTIKKLHGLAGGNKTDANVATGTSSQPALPAAGPRPPMGAPAATPPAMPGAPTPGGGNPLATLSKVLSLMKPPAAASTYMNPAAGGMSVTGSVAPAVAAGAPAVAAPAAAGAPDILALLGLA